MSLYSLEHPENVDYPNVDDIKDFWQLKKSIDTFYWYVSHYKQQISRVKREMKADKGKFPPDCYPTYTEIIIGYTLFFIGYNKKFTREDGGISPYDMHKFDEQQQDGGEDEWGGIIHVEQNKKWCTPRKARIFI